MRTALLGALVVVGALVGPTAPGAAVPQPGHARLFTSTPAADAVLADPPDSVELTFTREIAPPATVVVTAPSGDRLGTAEPGVHGPTVSTPFTAREPGSYRVAYRVVSVDGHPIAGSFVFSVGHRSAIPANAPEGGSRVPWVLPAVVAAAALGLWRLRRRAGLSRRARTPGDAGASPPA